MKRNIAGAAYALIGAILIADTAPPEPSDPYYSVWSRTLAIQRAEQDIARQRTPQRTVAQPPPACQDPPCNKP
jgi:hypothetical protein